MCRGCKRLDEKPEHDERACSWSTTTADDDIVSAHLQQDATDGRIEIVKYRANLAIVKVKREM